MVVVVVVIVLLLLVYLVRLNIASVVEFGKYYSISVMQLYSNKNQILWSKPGKSIIF